MNGVGLRNVYLNEYNVMLDRTTYLPIVSGLLQAYADTRPFVADQYRFMPALFLREDPERILGRYDEPVVAGFSTFMWNEQLCLRVAEGVKRRFPGCFVLFGGRQIPGNGTAYLREHPFLDATVSGEGEESFADILERLAATRDMSGIPGVSWRNPRTGEIIANREERPFDPNIDRFVSPYLSGIFRPLLETNMDIEFQAILQTNRGCPFTCAYCSWMKGPRMRYFSMERIASEIDWCASNRIRYIFNADSNFGIHKRDLDVARHLVEVKERHGFPEKFRSCFTKNADERIFELAMLLNKSRLEKGITLSFQSLNETALRNVGRQNIRLSTYRNLLRKMNSQNVPVYTELILGLPGETSASWIEGVERIFQSGLKGQLFVYPCEVYPNTGISDQKYRRKHGLVTRRILLTEIHGSVREEQSVPEYQEIIVSTSDMPLDEWRRMLVFSCVTMLLWSLKLGIFLLKYLAARFSVKITDFVIFLIAEANGPVIRGELEFLGDRMERIVSNGEGRGVDLPEFGGIYWDLEEACFLRVSRECEAFYRELSVLASEYLEREGVRCDPEELKEVIRYQRIRSSLLDVTENKMVRFQYDVPGYIDKVMNGEEPALSREHREMEVQTRGFGDDLVRFARETILWGRKSDNLLNPVRLTEMAGEGGRERCRIS